LRNLTKNKILAVLFAILMSSSIAMISSTPAEAQLAQEPIAGPKPSGVTPSIEIDTHAYLSFTPNPIGVEQTLLVNIWLQPPTNIQRDLANAFEVVITKPDGTKDTYKLSSYQGDATGWLEYVPSQEGNYTLQFNFLGMYYPEGRYFNGKLVTNSSGTNLNSAYYKPSSSPIQTLVVQKDMVWSWPPAALPNDYWTRPVSPNNREWWTILGAYPATGYSPVNPIYASGVTWDSLYPNTSPYWTSTSSFIPYVQAPNTAHVAWKRQVDIGGLIGGQLGTISARPDSIPGAASGGWLYPSIIFAGRCYQTVPKVFDGVTQNVWQCYDLRTGEIYWEKINSSTFNVAQAPTIVGYTERTAQAVPGEEAMMRGMGVTLMYIGGGRLIKYQPFTGATLVNVSISPLTSSTYYMREYALGVQDLGASAGSERYRLINWTTNDAGTGMATGTAPSAAVTNFTQRIVSNITWPISSLPAYVDYAAGIAVSVTSINPSGVSGTGVAIGQGLMGINIRTGQVMWNTSTVSKNDGSETFFTTNNCVADNGVFIGRMIEGEIRGWDLYTGKLKWSTQLPYPWAEFGPYHIAHAYGLYITGTYNGVFAINQTNGNIEWQFNAYTPYQFETPYQTTYGSAEYAFHVGVQIADGKLYVSAAEHTPSQPLTRGLNLYCIDMFSGKQLWNFSASQVDQSRAFTGAIAEGYLVFGSQYDSTMYVFGKGKSATTIDAPLTAITKGQSIIIRGTVLDQTPAQPGTPCVSAESMSEWMNYLHTQGPMPSNIIGVPVSIDAVDPNENFVHIADVVADGSGVYSYMWTPELAGKYTVTTTFMGDDSYASSYATTVVGVVDAPQATPTPSPITGFATVNDVMTYSSIVAIAVIIALALVAILLLKKQK
jgi:outer membrane protein assembly factor BamB